MNHILPCGSLTLDLNHTHVMGVLNVTPDSFSDGGKFIAPQRALEHAGRMIEEGASVIDVGGESTRPGAAPVDAAAELERVVPVIEALTGAFPDIVISVDTSKPQVMRAAVAAGAGLINDVRALREDGALDAAAASNAAICLMHMRGEPRTMQEAPHYDDVVTTVQGFLAERAAACENVGIDRARLIVDPGFGFGKSLAHNLTLLRRLGELRDIGLPLLVGISRKSMIGAILDAPLEARANGSVAAAVIAAQQGARVIRSHDVRATVEAVRIMDAVRDAP